jgi:aryl-alcohol dehydrogenase-like predicted oxidoreductase
MKQRQLGKNGPLVGEVGLGAMSLAGAFGPTDAATSHRTLDMAVERGVTHIDTALIYGPFVSEQVIGDYLKKNPTAKHKFSIATKGGIVPNPRCVDNSVAFMRECLEGSLKRLGVDSIDLYYIHRRQFDLPIEDVMATMLEFQKQGKIRGIGFSEISPASLHRASDIGHVCAVQNEYSLWTRLPELGLLQACKKLGTAFVAFSPLARGALSDVALNPENFANTDFRKGLPRFQPDNFKRNMAFTDHFRTYAKQRGWNTSALAIAWVLAQHDHIIPIPGTRTPEHLAMCSAGAEIKLTPQDLAEIAEILPVGFAHGNRYSDTAQAAVEIYC